MRKLNLLALIAVLFLSFSCEREELVEIEEVATTEKSSIVARTAVTDTFQTIDDLRAAGIPVSNRLQNRVNNDLQALLDAVDLARTRNGRRQLRRQGFDSRLIRQLRRIGRQIDDLQAADDNTNDPVDPIDPPVDPVDPPVDPAPTPDGILTVADLNLSQLALNALANSPNAETNVNSFVLEIATNTFGNPFRNNGNGNFVRLAVIGPAQSADRQFTADQVVGNVLQTIGSRLNIPVDSNFATIRNEFRPLAINAVGNLVALVNQGSPGVQPVNPPSNN